jgi:pentatricopeptide repeat protein
MQSEDRFRPLHIFLSFAHEDRAFRNTLDTHLSIFQRTGVIDDWHKHEIPPGSEWQDLVDKQLDQADIILLFITPDFIASKYCYSVQMNRALEKHERGAVRVIPILFRPTFWYDLPFAKLQGLPMSEKETIKPVSQWKNRDQAFVKIIEGIKKAIEDLTGHTPHPTTPTADGFPPLWTLPYQRNRFFTARDDLLDSLHATFTKDRGTSIIVQVISGLGGIGKTQIALEYAYRYSADYQAVFWLRGDTTEDLLTDFAQLARLLTLPEHKESDQQVLLAAIKRSLSQASGWLLIFDNLDTIELLDEFIPVRGQGDILITTRGQATGGTALLNDVEKMTLDEGALFLLRRAKIVADTTPLHALPAAALKHAREICHAVDGLPLALDQAGAYLEATKIGLAAYSTLYKKRETALLKQRGKFAAGHPSSVATTLALCLTTVQQRNQAARELLSFCAFLHPDAIPIEIVTAAAPDLGPTLQSIVLDELELNTALEVLFDLSLLRRNRDTEALSLHRLVQVVLRDEMNEETQRLWSERALKALSRLFPEPEFEVWQHCQRYLPHALLLSEQIEQWHFTFPEAARLLYRAGSYLYQRASYHDAQRLCEQALLIYGNEHPETAYVLERLGEITESMGDDYARAQHFYEQAREIGEPVWGPEHPALAHLLNNLGELSQTQGYFSQAEQYYRHALAIRENSFGLEHPDTAGSLNNVAGIREEQGDYAEAERLYEQALHLRERLLGSYHPDTAESLSNVARFYRIIGKYSQARPLYERALVAYEQAFGPEHPRVATCLNNFAVCCLAVGQYTQAEQLLTRALLIRTQLFGFNHPIPAGSWNHLARVYSKQGRYEQAWTLYEQVQVIYGREHPNTAVLLTHMGELSFFQSDYSQAEALLTEALTIITERQGARHPSAASVLDLLGRLYFAQGKNEEAEPFLTEALAIRQEALGKTHPETGVSLKNLGDLAVARNNAVQAEIFYQQALEILLASLGSDHPDIIELGAHLVELLKKMGRAENPQMLLEKIRPTENGEERT